MNERLDEDEEGLMEVLDSGSLLLGVERDEGLMERFLCLGSTDFSPTDQTSISKSSTSKRKIKKGDSCEGLGGNKKQRKEVFSSVATIKVRKDKLGDRISMLQQLVSPFGKSDTASVLLEALGYIRFLHDQVQVLSSPYLQRQPTAAHIQDNKGEGSRRLGDLRSRGLCLVPITCTEDVANNNGADYWSSATGSNINLNH